MGALGAAGMASCAQTDSRSGAAIAYDPKAGFELEVNEVEYRRTPKGRALMARIYRPRGAGPFPVVLDLHGGAWNTKDRMAEQPMDRAIASSGALVVAIDLTLAPESPYPANVQDANFAVRWLKSKARQWGGDPVTLGVYGSSSGGHVAELLGMRPTDARYNAIALEGAPNVDAVVSYVATRSPISDTFARYQNAEQRKRASLIKSSRTYFNPWETVHEANPQEILERREKAMLVPLLVMQGALDDNLLPAVQERFVNTYRTAGGKVSYSVFENSIHDWVQEPSPQTTRAQEMVKAFIAEQLAARRRTSTTDLIRSS